MKNLKLFDLKCFHSDFQPNPESDNTNDVVVVNHAASNECASPGMDHLIQAQQRKAQKHECNTRYNKGLETIMVCADYLGMLQRDFEIGPVDFHTVPQVFSSFSDNFSQAK